MPFFFPTYEFNFQVSKNEIRNCQDSNNKAMEKKYGMGKGLMTVWRVTNPDAGELPIGFGSADHEAPDLPLITNPSSQKLVCENKKPKKILAMAVSYPTHNSMTFFKKKIIFILKHVHVYFS